MSGLGVFCGESEQVPQNFVPSPYPTLTLVPLKLVPQRAYHGM